MLPLRKERAIANISLTFLPNRESQLIAFTEDGLSLDVRVDAEKETVWLTQAEMAEFFDVDRTQITARLSIIYKDGELDKSATCAESARFQKEGLFSENKTVWFKTNISFRGRISFILLSICLTQVRLRQR